MDQLALSNEKAHKEIQETQDSMAQAQNLRKQENEQWTEDMVINTQSLSQIDAAINHVSSVGQHRVGFLQNGQSGSRQLHNRLAPDSSYVLGIMKGLRDRLEQTRTSLQKVESEKA